MSKSGRRRWLSRGLIVLVVLGAVLAVVAWRLASADRSAPRYVSVAARRGSLDAMVTATGNLEALDQVDVGAEVSGRVSAVHVDFNDEVKRGQVLCELDPSQFVASKNQASAQVRVAEAEFKSRAATQAEAELVRSRTSVLVSDGLATRAELEAADAALRRAEAALSSARAQIGFARAALEIAETSLEKTKIRAPIDGIVLERAVEPGQALAATFAAPTLFKLARDLRRMELHIDIDEADIGRVRERQVASFVVDAHPGRTFPAELTSIHNVATTLENVVTYEALLLVKNDDLVLRPGMTATVTITVARGDDVLLVPNAALRFTPPSALTPLAGPPNPFARRQPASESDAGAAGRAGATVWILEAGQPRSVPLRTGLSDGEWTEVVSGEIEVGTEVLVDVVTDRGSGRS